MTFCANNPFVASVLKSFGLVDASAALLSRKVDVSFCILDRSLLRRQKAVLSNYYNSAINRFFGNKLQWAIECPSIAPETWADAGEIPLLIPPIVPLMKKRKIGREGMGMKLIETSAQLAHEQLLKNRHFFFQKFVDTRTGDVGFNKLRVYVIFDMQNDAMPYMFENVEFAVSKPSNKRGGGTIVHLDTGMFCRDVPGPVWNSAFAEKTLEHLQTLSKAIAKKARLGNAYCRFLFCAMDILTSGQEVYIIDINRLPGFRYQTTEQEEFFREMWQSAVEQFTSAIESTDRNRWKSL